ncbi:MAG: NusG domain II-containing protein [Clostridiales bacterium]|nr:NusG domain II-containing protein [Clostridiales bacterium]
MEQVKKRKPFALWDLVVYGALAALIVVLFAVFVFTADKTPLTGVKIEREGNILYTYTFGTGSEIAPAGAGLVEERSDDNLVYVTVYRDGEKGKYNTLVIDTEKRTIKMHETNCSIHQDCMYMTEISAVNGVIICVPHGLKITALNAKEEFRPSIG